MAQSDRISKVVTAAVVEALNKDQSGLVAEITADVLNGADDSGGYASMFASIYGGYNKKTYLERVARDEIRAIAGAAVKEWIAARSEDLRLAVFEKMNVEALADSYVARLNRIAEEAEIDVRVDISSPSSGDDE